MVKIPEGQKTGAPGKLQDAAEGGKTSAAFMLRWAFHKRACHILLILSFGLIAYSNTFKVPFTFDDYPYIVENPLIKDLAFFFAPSKGKESADYALYGSFKSRYIAYLTFTLNYKLHGLAVSGYHVFNVAVHITNALLVYWLIVVTFKTPFRRRSGN